MLIHAGYPPLVQRHYAGIRNASVSSSACQFFRIGYVYGGQDRGSQFRLADETPFAITADEGILYVDNPQRLRTGNQSSYSLKIHYRNASGTQEVDLDIDVTDAEFSGECQAPGSALCAEFRTEHECSRNRALTATDERGCSWRGANSSESSSRLTTEYSTCSTNLATCPDGHCDDLEAKHWNICPQDCTGSYNLIHN